MLKGCVFVLGGRAQTPALLHKSGLWLYIVAVGDFLRLFWTLTTQKWKSSKRKLGLFTFQSKWADCFALAVTEKQQHSKGCERVTESYEDRLLIFLRFVAYWPGVKSRCIWEGSDFRELSFVSSPIALKKNVVLEFQKENCGIGLLSVSS